MKQGLHVDTPINVNGKLIKPIDFAIAYIINSRERILKETNLGLSEDVLRLLCKVRSTGNPDTIVFSLASENQALGEGTGIPVAFGAIMLNRKLITKTGVLPPEACVDPLEFLGILQEHLSLDSASGGSSPLTIESIDSEGTVEKITL